jgi:hypothetical protein
LHACPDFDVHALDSYHLQDVGLQSAEKILLLQARVMLDVAEKVGYLS